MSSLRKFVPCCGVLVALLSTSTPARAQCELEIQEFESPDGQAGDAFSYRIARSGDLAVMAAPFDDDLGLDAGSAYVYERHPVAGWVFSAKLLASNGAAGDSFSYSLAIAGRTILVGAPGHDGHVQDRGSVYAFERDRLGNWRERARFRPPTAVDGGQFGYSLAAHGERFLVGMPPVGRPTAGAAILYRRDPASLSGWRLEREFTAEDPATAFVFGHAVALSDDVLAVSGSTTFNQPYSDSYVVHIRERDAGGPGNWGEVRTIASPTGSRDIFGYKLALDGNLLAAVAPAEQDATFRTGALYLYARGGGGASGWNLARRLHSRNALNDLFTAELSVLAGDWLVAGLPTGSSAGSVHVFGRNVGGSENWGEVALLQDFDLGEGAGFGQGLALEGDELLVGASGYYFNDVSSEVYVYDLARLARSEWRGDSLGVNVDSYRAGPAVLGEVFTGTVNLATTGHPMAVLSCFESAAEIVLPGGQVLLGQDRCQRMTSSGPLATFQFAIPNIPSLCGRVFVTQAAHVGGSLPVVLSNAQDVVLGVR